MASVSVKIPGDEPGTTETPQESLQRIVADEWQRVTSQQAAADVWRPQPGSRQDEIDFENSGPPRFTDFRQSNDVDDRRNESWLARYSQPVRRFTGGPIVDWVHDYRNRAIEFQPGSPLSVEAGYNNLPVPKPSFLSELLDVIAGVPNDSTQR